MSVNQKLAKVLTPRSSRTPVKAATPLEGALAQVTAVNHDGTIDVTLNGANNTQINCLGSFIPHVGDVVVCLALGTQVWAIGPASVPPQGPSYLWGANSADSGSGLPKGGDALVVVGTDVQTTNTAGGAATAYHNVFPTGTLSVVACYGDNTYTGGPLCILESQVSYAGFGWQAVGANTVSIRINYIAYGY